MKTLIPLISLVLLMVLLYQLQCRQVSYNKRVMLALVMGVVLGCCCQLFLTGHSVAMHAVRQVFDLVGEGYLALLKMLVVPLVLTSIIDALLNVGELSGDVVRRIAVRSVIVLLVMTSVASAIGLMVGSWFSVGAGLSLPVTTLKPSHVNHGVVDTLVHMLPSNPIAAMANGNSVAIVLFAGLLGMSALLLLRQDANVAKPFQQFIKSAFAVTKKLASMVIALTPYGVLALVAGVTSTQGLGTLLAISHYIVAMIVAMFLVFVMHALVVLLKGMSPWRFWQQAYPALLVAFTTRSSFGTLPVSESTLRKRFGVSQLTASFVPSLGATMGMNACAGVFPAMLVVMSMTILHMPITLAVIFKVMLINAIASLGVSGIPGTASVAAAVTLSALGLPYSVIGLVQGVDPIIDMFRTATNIDGVMATGVVVDQPSFLGDVSNRKANKAALDCTTMVA